MTPDLSKSIMLKMENDASQEAKRPSRKRSVRSSTKVVDPPGLISDGSDAAVKSSGSTPKKRGRQERASSSLNMDASAGMKEKPMLKLFFKSSDSGDISSNGGEKKDVSTLLRIRLGSSDDKLNKPNEETSISPVSAVRVKRRYTKRAKLESQEKSPKKEKVKKVKGEKKAKKEKREKDEDESIKPAVEEPVIKETISNQTVNEEVVNDDYCAGCKSPGNLLCCETCPNSYHLICLLPPLETVPEGIWQCVECRVSRPLCKYNDPDLEEAASLKDKPIENYKDLWDCIWANSILTNPVSFILPKKLRPKMEGPPTLEFFDEQTLAAMNQPKRKQSVSEGKKPSSSYPSRRSANNRHVTPTIENLRIVEEGQCHRCNQRSILPSSLPLRATPLVPKPLIKCDKCHLLWHLDCLDPPLTIAPKAESKWSCPVHLNLPIHPNWIPDVELENFGNPFEYEVALRLIGETPPPDKIILPESSIKLAFFNKVSQMRQQLSANVTPPDHVKDSYAKLAELASIDS